MKKDMHLHSKYSDGRNSVEEMIKVAIEIGLREICFCDHVRETSDWVDVYFKDLTAMQGKYKDSININIGVETKIVDFNGNLDVPIDINSKILQVAAIHRISNGDGTYISRKDIKQNQDKAMNSYINCLKGLDKNSQVSRIAHPFSLFTEFDETVLTDELWCEIDEIFTSAKYGIEFNLKYPNHRMPKWFYDKYNSSFIIGSDSHSIEELKTRNETFYKGETLCNS